MLGLAAVPKAREGVLLRYIRVISHKHQLLLTPPFTKLIFGAVQQPLLGASELAILCFAAAGRARAHLAVEDAREKAPPARRFGSGGTAALILRQVLCPQCEQEELQRQ